MIEREKDNKQTRIEVFLVRKVDQTKLKLNPNEGQGIVAISKTDNLRSLKLTQTARELLELYFGKKLGKLE